LSEWSAGFGTHFCSCRTAATRPGNLSLLVPAFLYCLVVLPLCRLLIVWVYDHTETVLLAVVMHASITGIVAMIVIPLDARGWPLTWRYLVLRRPCCLWRSPSTSSLFEGIGHDRRRQALPTRDAGRPRVTVEAASSPST
jgi:hypothetical protein